MSIKKEQWFIYYWNGIISLLASVGFIVVAVMDHFKVENEGIAIVFLPFTLLFYLFFYTIPIGSFVALIQMVYGLVRYFKLSKGNKAYLKHCIGGFIMAVRYNNCLCK